MITWRELLEEARHYNEDKSPLKIYPENLDLDRKFDGESWGRIQGEPFTAWSDDWVYFPAEYDGSEYVTSVPRNPCEIATNHIGGGGC